MPTPNKHIIDYLDYYVDLEIAPEYAVLLKGAWGVGKTWLIKTYLEKFDKTGKKYLYVSLYGLTSFTTIQEEMFNQLHPVLGSKGMRLAGKFLTGALSSAFKVDLNSDSKDDGTVSFKVPDIKLPEYLNTEGFLLIFDDLERCPIKASDLLGYINHFVEHQGYKAVIIANEDEILRKENRLEPPIEADLPYYRIKEKLIGQTFEINPDFSAAFEHFMSSVSTELADKVFSSNKELIEETYNFSGYRNLRHLRQALLEFERLLLRITPEAAEKADLVAHLLQSFLAYSFEIKSGNLQLSKAFSSKAVQSATPENSVPHDPLSKYKTKEFYGSLLQRSTWANILERGIVDSEEINESLFKSRYFKSETTPTWVKLWNWHDLTDDEFSNLILELEQEISSEQHSSLGVIIHITGMLLWFSDVGMYAPSKGKILDKMKAHIETLKTNNLLPEPKKADLFSFGFSGWSGLGFVGENLPEFQEFKIFLKDKLHASEAERLPEAGEKLLKTMRDDPDMFCRMIFLCNEHSIYYDAPIFRYISARNFTENLIELTPNKQSLVGTALAERYKNNQYKHILKEELDWLKEVTSILMKEKDKLHGKPSGFILNAVIANNLNPSIDILSSCQEIAQAQIEKA